MNQLAQAAAMNDETLVELRNLREALNGELITQDEFNARRERILGGRGDFVIHPMCKVASVLIPLILVIYTLYYNGMLLKPKTWITTCVALIILGFYCRFLFDGQDYVQAANSFSEALTRFYDEYGDLIHSFTLIFCIVVAGFAAYLSWEIMHIVYSS